MVGTIQRLREKRCELGAFLLALNEYLTGSRLKKGLLGLTV